MESIPRQVPRYPGPKYDFLFWADVPSSGSVALFTPPGTGYFYILEEVDVNVLGSSTGTETFQIMAQVGPAGTQPVPLFSGQVSPNTGIYFPWRGSWDIRNIPLTLVSLGGPWSAVLRGFITFDTNI